MYTFIYKRYTIGERLQFLLVPLASSPPASLFPVVFVNQLITFKSLCNSCRTSALDLHHNMLMPQPLPCHWHFPFFLSSFSSYSLAVPLLHTCFGALKFSCNLCCATQHLQLWATCARACCTWPPLSLSLSNSRSLLHLYSSPSYLLVALKSSCNSCRARSTPSIVGHLRTGMLRHERKLRSCTASRHVITSSTYSSIVSLAPWRRGMASRGEKRGW